MKKRRILLVDDEVGITRALALYLRENGGCDVRVENAGHRALETAREFRPNLIFLDVAMPDTDGGTLAAEIKADPVLHTTPIVFLTALVSRRTTGGAAKQIGGHPFLAKPVDPDSVLAYIDKYALADRSGTEKAGSKRLMVQALLSLTGIRDAETGRHSQRTQGYARVLAEQLSAHPRFRDYLTPERIDLLASLAPLHDIGKVGVPDRILNKPSELTAEELTEMRRHPEYGRDVIVKVEREAGAHDDSTLAIAKDIVYTHHERWDGTGYPQGLRGTEIPIPGRVMALVDVYDALLTRRLYRKPMLQAEATAFIVKGRGTHFDPAVVDAFVQVSDVLRGLSEVNDNGTVSSVTDPDWMGAKPVRVQNEEANPSRG